MVGDFTSRECEEFWRRVFGDGPSARSVSRLVSHTGEVWEESGAGVLAGMRDEEAIPASAGTVLASLDGAMMRMRGDAGQDTAWREASSGVVSLIDGEGSEAGGIWFGRYKRILREEMNGIAKVIDAVRYLVGRGRGGAELERELNFFRSNRSRMHCRKASDAGCPIGSGSVDSCNSFLIAQRLKRSGQRWGRTGGKAALTIRSLVKSGRFDRASQRLREYWRTMRPVPTRPPPPTTALAACFAPRTGQPPECPP